MKAPILDQVQPKKTKHLAKSLLTTRLPRQHFDPANKLDRENFLNFKKTGRWNYLFYCKPPYSDTVSMCSQQILDFYLQQEFNDNANQAK